MDMQKREALIQRFGKVIKYRGGMAPETMPLVSPDDYFDGAEGEASLLCNSLPALSNDEVLEGLKKIAARDGVFAVHVALTDCEDDLWPNSDKLVVVTRASDDEILSWLPSGFRPDEIYERKDLTLPAAAAAVPPGYREVWMWFD